MTPRELWLVIDGERDRWMEGVWHLAALMRMRKLPRLSELLQGGLPPQALPADQLLEKARQISRALGGTEGPQIAAT